MKKLFRKIFPLKIHEIPYEVDVFGKRRLVIR